MNIRIENSQGFHPFFRRLFYNDFDNFKKYYLADIIASNLMIEESYDSNLSFSENIMNRLDISNKFKNGGILYLASKSYFIPPILDIESYSYTFKDLIINLIEHRESVVNKFNLIQTNILEQCRDIEKDYEKGNSSGIIDYFNNVLVNSFYYIPLPQNDKKFKIEYFPENKLLFCDLYLPTLEETPNLKKYSVNSMLKEKFEYFSEKEIKKIYNKINYSIIIRTINELFSFDYKNYFDLIAINGKVKRINPATGIETDNCILSIQTNKNEFSKINPKQVDPYSCFKYLKGLSGIDLSNCTPIKPIIQINEDRRIVESRDIEFSEYTNLASMNWEDFEHLIRELFEKEFSSNGGEVKVTQASRDGGVDAIAYDPDPIKGGKIVIQAKRYTNIVGVSAVRDLYGTVLNEGANKGILVTTSDYGSDSYEFIKGKPLTLLNGNNLLYLLEKHGQKAKIDIQEARDLLNKN